MVTKGVWNPELKIMEVAPLTEEEIQQRAVDHEVHLKEVERQHSKPLLAQLGEVLNSLSDDELAAYAPAIGAALVFDQMGRPGAIQKLIEGVEPLDPSHETLKESLIGKIQKEQNKEDN